MTDFKYGQSFTAGGYIWYCQDPGRIWRTDPVVGDFALEFVRSSRREPGDRGWYLFTPDDSTGEWMGAGFREAARAAVPKIAD